MTTYAELSDEQKDALKARVEAWRSNNPEKARAARKLWYHKNQDRLRALSRENYRRHKVRNKNATARFLNLHPWYRSWQSARDRCTNKNCPSYRLYGAKGVRFLLSKADMAFLWQRDNASKMYRPSIDRLEPAGDYTIENCRFVPLQQNRIAGLNSAWKTNRERFQAKLDAAAVKVGVKARTSTGKKVSS